MISKTEWEPDGLIRLINSLFYYYSIFYIQYYNFTWIIISVWNIFSITQQYLILKLHKNSRSICYNITSLTRLLWQLEKGLRTQSLEQARCTFILTYPSNDLWKQKGSGWKKEGFGRPYRCHPEPLFSYTFISDDKESLRRGILTRGRIKLSFSPSHP